MLSNKVNEIMTTQLTATEINASIKQAVDVMAREDVGRIIIVDEGVPCGIFTEKDVVKRVLAANLDLTKTVIKDVMTAPISAVREETHIVEALGRMYKGKFRHLLVRGRRGKVIGIVSMRRILNLAVELGQGQGNPSPVGSIVIDRPSTADLNTPVQEIVELMAAKNLTAVIVTENDKPIGIFTERDALKRVAAAKAIKSSETPIKVVMTQPLITVPENAMIGAVLAEMYRRDIRNMPVKDTKGELRGLLAMPQILQYAQAFDIDEQVRRSWKEVAEALETDDQYTPG